MPADNRVTLRKKYAEELLDDEEYRKNLRTRLRAGMCSPQLEVLLHQYLYGKPVDEVQITTTNELAGKSDDELRERLREINSLVSNNIH